MRSARAATFAYFVLNGTLVGLWVVHIPAIEQRAGISHATLGGFLLLLGAGAFAGMRVAGPLTDRLGARIVVPTAGALCSAGLALPGLAASGWALAVALVLFGVGNGCLDVSMNAHAVRVEQAYGRPVMSAFHATFSVGGVLAAGVAAATSTWGWTPALTLSLAAGIGVIIAVAATPALLPGRVPPAPERQPKRTGSRRIRVLAVLALLVMLSEGAAYDWSALHLTSVLGTTEATAAFAYGVFATTMTVGRLLADRASARFGQAAILRYGAGVAAVGLAAAALAPSVWLALLGWAVYGAGLSGCVPQLFSAAGQVDVSAAGANVSRVASLGYLGLLAGPAVIGWLTHVMPLNLALLLPVLLCVITAGAAGVLRERRAAEPVR